MSIVPEIRSHNKQTKYKLSAYSNSSSGLAAFYTTTFDVLPTWKEETARKKAEAFASVFEKECKDGIKTDNRQRFDGYCDYVIGLKEQRGVKHSTIVRYKELTSFLYGVELLLNYCPI